MKVVDPAQGADQFTTPLSGDRLVGTQFTLTIGGTGSLVDDPTTDATLVDSQGNVYTPIAGNLQGCGSFVRGLSLIPGKTQTGCVTFELGTTTLISSITFTPCNQFGSVTAQWTVP